MARKGAILGKYDRIPGIPISASRQPRLMRTGRTVFELAQHLRNEFSRIVTEGSCDVRAETIQFRRIDVDHDLARAAREFLGRIAGHYEVQARADGQHP